MTLRTGHGTGGGQPRIEVLPPDELPQPVPAPEQAIAPVEQPAPIQSYPAPIDLAARKAAAGKRSGEVRRANAAALIAAEAERVEREARRLALTSALGLAKLDATADFYPYRAAGDAWVEAHLVELAAQAGGRVGPGPASVVASAAMQLAASRFWSDKAAASAGPAMFTLASSLANASRQNLLAAYELAVREAQARPRNVLPPGYRLVESKETPK